MGLALEDFDEVVEATLPPDDTGPSEEWQSGYAAGRAEAEADHAASQEALSEALLRHLEDMAFGYAEARSMLLTELEPLFHTLSERLLPALEDDLLAAHLVHGLETAAATDLATPLTLHVSVAEVVPVSDLLASATGIPFTCRADASLPKGTALISGTSGSGTLHESSLDIAQLTQGLRGILTAFASEQTQDSAHG